LRDFKEIGFQEKWGESGENGMFGGRRWVEVASGGAVGGWEVMGGGGAWWVWILGSDLEEKMEKKGGEVYGRYKEMRGMGKIDLKMGPGMAQLECVRTSISAFDRTRA
jgi:hypothetical protein